MNPTLDAALEFRRNGFAPIPCRPRDKIPTIAWKPYQETLPTEQELTGWFSVSPAPNIALLTGRGMVVVDLDGDGAEALLTDAGIMLPDGAPRVKTGNGTHVYLASPPGIGNRTAMLSTHGGKPQVDLRGEGGYVIAPPSLHPNGARYAWLLPLTMPLPPAPPALLQLIARSSSNGPTPATAADDDWFIQAWGGVAQGQRDATCARLAGLLFKRGHPPRDVLAMLSEWGGRCDPPFVPADVRRVVASIAKREAASGRIHAPITDAQEPTEDTGSVSLSGAIQQLRDELSGPAQLIVPTPFVELNHLLLGGFRAGQLTYIAARPSVGKSALSIEFARSATLSGHRVLMVSLESRPAQVALRSIAQEGKHEASDLAVGRIDPAMQHTMGRLSERDWFISKATDIPTIDAQLETLAPVQLLIVDYLQLLRGPQALRDRRLQVEWISRRLKEIATARDCAVLCLSSVTRASQDGADKAPTLSSMRESGELEHDADVVMLLHRPKKDSYETTCHLAKNRDGICGTVDLIFRPAYVSFSEVEKGD